MGLSRQVCHPEPWGVRPTHVSELARSHQAAKRVHGVAGYLGRFRQRHGPRLPHRERRRQLRRRRIQHVRLRDGTATAEHRGLVVPPGEKASERVGGHQSLEVTRGGPDHRGPARVELIDACGASPKLSGMLALLHDVQDRELAPSPIRGQFLRPRELLGSDYDEDTGFVRCPLLQALQPHLALHNRPPETRDSTAEIRSSNDPTSRHLSASISAPIRTLARAGPLGSRSASPNALSACP